jgi:hypothetical protein
MLTNSQLRLVRVAFLGVSFGMLVVILAIYFDRGFVPGDALVYLASGERLNAGHLLYALSPGDRIIAVKPPYWTVPTLSPPLMGVLFRPLAILPPDDGAYVWWFATIATIAATLVALVRRTPILTSVAVLVLSVPLAYEIGVGNVNAILLACSIGTWYAATRGHDRIAGVLVAFMVMVKVWPITLAWWLLIQRRWAAIWTGLAAGVILLVISLLGAGLGSYSAYLQVVRDTVSVGTSDLSLAGLARAIGFSGSIAVLVPWLVFLGSTSLAWVFRQRPGVSYCLCVVAMVLGSSVVNINSYALLLATLAPAAWPVPATKERGLDFPLEQVPQASS